MAVLVRDQAEARPDDAALVDETGQTSWGELDLRVNRLVHSLRSAGLGSGDTVAIVAGNRREWYELSMACGHTGITYVPVNWHWSVEELAYVFEDSGARAVFAGHRFVADVADALRSGPGIDLFVTIGATADGATPYEELVAAGSEAEPDDQTLGGPMFYTSGTTGHPKGVRGSLSGGQDVPAEVLLLVAAGFAEFIPPEGRTLLCGPIYHSAQWAFSLLPMLSGSSVTMRHRFDQHEVLDLIDAHAITQVHMVPTQFKRMLDLPDDVRAGFDGSSLVVVWHGAAPCPPQVKREMIEWWGPVINEYYGSTEGAVISTIDSGEWLERGGSVGKPLPIIEVMVLDDDGAPVDQGEAGTLYFRNQMGSDFEYHNDPDKTAAAHLEPGVFTTGDIGYLDEQGYLWLSDRKIDMIISGGVNIYPAEIEGVLHGHEAVADVAVFGVPDDEYGEQVKAAVVCRDGHEPSDDLAVELIGHCREHLAHYKAPKSIDWADELPRTESGKIQKKPLRQPYWEGSGRSI